MRHTIVALLSCGGTAAWLPAPMRPAVPPAQSDQLLYPPPPPWPYAMRGRQRAGRTRMADAFVLDRLAGIKRTFDELTARLEDPEIMSDTDTLCPSGFRLPVAQPEGIAAPEIL